MAHFMYKSSTNDCLQPVPYATPFSCRTII
jgi:hypothetical protein